MQTRHPPQPSPPPTPFHNPQAYVSPRPNPCVHTTPPCYEIRGCERSSEYARLAPRSPFWVESAWDPAPSLPRTQSKPPTAVPALNVHCDSAAVHPLPPSLHLHLHPRRLEAARMKTEREPEGRGQARAEPEEELFPRLSKTGDQRGSEEQQGTGTPECPPRSARSALPTAVYSAAANEGRGRR